MFAVGKSGPIATFDLIFLGLGWRWVGEFAGFTIMFILFPTQHKLVYRKHHTIPRAFLKMAAPQVTPEVVQSMREFFGPYNKALEDLLERPLPAAWHVAR